MRPLRRPSSPDGPYVVYGLRETYHELGRYEFKVVLNDEFFVNSRMSSVSASDSSMGSMGTEVDRWGRKMNCSFEVGPGTPDGIGNVDIVLSDGKKETKDRLFFWVIKP